MHRKGGQSWPGLTWTQLTKCRGPGTESPGRQGLSVKATGSSWSLPRAGGTAQRGGHRALGCTWLTHVIPEPTWSAPEHCWVWPQPSGTLAGNSSHSAVWCGQQPPRLLGCRERARPPGTPWPHLLTRGSQQCWSDSPEGPAKVGRPDMEMTETVNVPLTLYCLQLPPQCAGKP